MKKDKNKKGAIVSLLLVTTILFTSKEHVLAQNTTTNRNQSTNFVTNETTTRKDSEPAEVSSKEEVIYAALHGNGVVKDIYAVNILNVLSEGIINDYGKYKNLKNLTNTEILDYQNQKVSAYAAKGRFYYQGTLEETTLPWNIHVTYFVDGKEIAADQLAGSNGNLEIHIKTSANNSLNSSFYKNYLLQISVTLNTDLCMNISAEGAAIANAGKNQLLTFTVMPDTNGDIRITSEVTEFEMEGISLSAVPFSMNIEIPDTSDMSSQLTTLTDAIAQLNDGAARFKAGINSLNEGSTSLKSGSADFMGGMKTLNGSSKDLTEGSKAILEALSYINNNLNNSSGGLHLSSLEELPSGLTQLSNGLKQISKGLKNLNTGYSAAYTALNSAIASIPAEPIADKDIAELMANNPENKGLNQLLENYKAAQTVKETYYQVSAAFEAVQTNLPVFANSLDTMIVSLKTLSSEMNTALEQTDITSSLSQLTSGIAELESNYRKFDAGLAKYTEGIAKLNDVYSKVHHGIESLANGTKELSKGIEELAGGTNELYSETKNMPDQIESTVEEMLTGYEKSDFAPVSFISEEIKNVSLVQFVIKTEKIEKVQVEQQVTAEKEKETFWTRLRNLFT